MALWTDESPTFSVVPGVAIERTGAPTPDDGPNRICPAATAVGTNTQNATDRLKSEAAVAVQEKLSRLVEVGKLAAIRPCPG